uniref:Diacylglycerol kinase n=2 Tax=Caenorhabditis japonica TaxID=281687 RepID=A0A8R1DSS8_CAEJA
MEMDVYDELLAAALFIIFSTFILWLFRKLLAVRKRKTINDTSSKSGHYWSPIDCSEQHNYCSGCKEHIVSGYECDNCLLKVDNINCLRSISTKIQCKVNQSQCRRETFDHHWIIGNIGPDLFCEVCEELCGGGVGLQDFRCSWCWRVVHTRCKPKFTHRCDFGRLQRTIIPPYCVVTRKPGNRNQRMAVIDKVEIPTDTDKWRPIMVIVNPKSGSGAGKQLLRNFRAHLHPAQVVDVLKSNIAASLRWIDEHPEVDVRILIAGGDGTICSTLDQIDTLSRRIPVAVLPLGTGNDLSRWLKWGKKCGGDVDVIKLMEDIQDAEVTHVDRWTIDAESQKKLGVRLQSNKTLSMTNYVSIGVDACVTLGMQNTRESIPRAMSSRFLNKFLFFTFGTKDVFERVCKGLNERIDLYLDDVHINLPDIEGLIFLNIPYWGAGVKPWSTYNGSHRQDCDDETIEVFAVTSSFHIAQMQIGLASPLCIGQAKHAKLVLKGNHSFPMQSDGEAWVQSAGTVLISHKCKTAMLRKVEKRNTGCGMFF